MNVLCESSFFFSLFEKEADRGRKPSFGLFARSVSRSHFSQCLLHTIMTNCFLVSPSSTGLNMSESQNSPPPQLGTNSSSVAIAILVPFFALIFTGFGFYLYKQRCAPDLFFYLVRPGVFGLFFFFSSSHPSL